MPRTLLILSLAALLTPNLLTGQGTYGRRTRAANVPNPGGYNGPAVTFQGKLKELTKKELRIDVESEEQSITCRVSSKTNFFKDGKKVKLADIPIDSVVAVDATRDPDQKFSAWNVILNPPKPKPDAQ